jgi:hypothetical protein
VYHSCLSIGWKQAQLSRCSSSAVVVHDSIGRFRVSSVRAAPRRRRSQEVGDVSAMTLRSADTLELLAFPKLAPVHVRTGREGSPGSLDHGCERLGIGIEPAQHRIQGDDQFVAVNALSFSGRSRVIVANLFATEWWTSSFGSISDMGIRKSFYTVASSPPLGNAGNSGRQCLKYGNTGACVFLTAIHFSKRLPFQMER